MKSSDISNLVLNQGSGRLLHREVSIYGVKNRTIALSKPSNTAKLLTGLIQVPIILDRQSFIVCYFSRKGLKVNNQGGEKNQCQQTQ